MSSTTHPQKSKYLESLGVPELRDMVVRRLFAAQGVKELPGLEAEGDIQYFLSHSSSLDTNLFAVYYTLGAITLAPKAVDKIGVSVAMLRGAAERKIRVAKIQRKPDVLVLAASGIINGAARRRISEEIPNAHVQFLGQEELIKQLDEFCPDVWAEISANVTPYLQSLSRLVDEQGVLNRDTLHLLGGKGSFLGAADESYVDIKLVRPRSTMTWVHGRSTERLEFEEITGGQLAKLKAARVLVLGDAGSGKSTLLIRLAYLMAKDGVTSPENYQIPLFCRATDIAENLNSDVLSVCAESVQRLTKIQTRPFSNVDLEKGRVSLLIDGFDEVSSDLTRDEIMNRLDSLSAEYPKITIIITTRPYASIERIPSIAKYTRYRISPISVRDAERILGSIRGRSADGMSSLETLRRLDAVHGIDLNPLFVTVFGLLAETDKKDLPANITELFSKFTELMLGRWDTNKGRAQQYQAKLKENLVAKFAFSMHRSRRTRFTRTEFEAFVAVRLNEMNLSSDLPVILEETIDRSGLFKGDGGNVEFRHHLIQEYFAGLGIPNLEFIRSVITEDWWRTPVVFFFGKDANNVDGLLDVATSVRDSTVEPCITIGLALQTLYLSPIRERVEVWKWVVECAARATNELSHDSASDYPLIEFVTYYLGARDSVALSGIERDDLGISDWAQTSHGNALVDDLRMFWTVTGLIELGKMEAVQKMLSVRPISDERLNTALYIGCQMVATVRAVRESVRALAREICDDLEERTINMRRMLAQEFKGKLLELRRGEIVALDDEYEAPR